MKNRQSLSVKECDCCPYIEPDSWSCMKCPGCAPLVSCPCYHENHNNCTIACICLDDNISPMETNDNTNVSKESKAQLLELIEQIKKNKLNPDTSKRWVVDSPDYREEKEYDNGLNDAIALIEDRLRDKFNK